MINIKYFRNHDNDNNVYEKQSSKVLKFKTGFENQLCEDIPLGYAKVSMSSSNLLLCLVRRETGKFGDRILGFATLQFEPSGKLYISIICASLEMKGGGTKLMQGIKQIGRQIKCKSIYLESVNNQNTINFYLKESFKFTGLTKQNKEALHCNENNDFNNMHTGVDNNDDVKQENTDSDLCIMKYEFSGGRRKTVKRQKSNRKSKKSNKIKTKKN